LTTAVADRSRWGQEDVVVPMAKETSGGSIDNEVSEVAVKPTGPRPASAVTTTTPAGYLRNTCLNRPGAIPVAEEVAEYEDTATVNFSPEIECRKSRKMESARELQSRDGQTEETRRADVKR